MSDRQIADAIRSAGSWIAYAIFMGFLMHAECSSIMGHTK